MATSSDAGASAPAYGGGGAGGKFRKKPFRRANLPTTPYDRPLAARISNPGNGSSSNNPGLFAKLVVLPASKLISYGAHRLFSSVFRKRLPPPPPQTPDVNCHLSDELQVAVSDCDVLKSGGGTSSQPLCSSDDDGISELEQLLKHKTFSRSEVDHLTGLLLSRAAVEMSSIVGPKRSGGGSPDFERHQPFASSPSEEKMQDRDKSLGVMPSPVINSRVVEDDMASPADLAKAYMGSRPSKISPSNLGTHHQVRREDAGLLSNVPFASKSPNILWNMTASVGLGEPKNGFITPKSRGRSAIYNMARTPYSRVHPLTIKKEIGSTNNCYGLSIHSASSSLVEQNEKIEAKSMTLKRSSSVLDDDPGFVGPMRRLRQKPNLLASRIPVIAHGMESGSDLALVSSKQKLPLVFCQKNRVSKIAGQNEDDSTPSASYACVSSKSTEVATRILRHLEKLTPKDKSSESKLATVREKSTFKLTPSMLHGQALRSMEDVDSSKLLLASQDDHKLEDRSVVALSHGQVSTLERPGKVENGYKETAIVFDMLTPVVKNEVIMSSTIPSPNRTADSAVKYSVAESPQIKRAFRMSAPEDFLELDDDEQCYGLAARPLAEGREPPDEHSLGNKCSDYEEPKLLKTTSQPEVKLPVVLSKRTESSNPSAPIIEIGNHGISLSLSESESISIQSDVLSQSAISFEKTNGTNDSVTLFGLGSQTADNIPPLPFESVSVKPESKSENSTSLLDAVSTANGSRMETPESDQGVYLNPLKTRDANGKPDTMMPFASNGPLFSSAPTVSFTTTSHDANQISTVISTPLICSTSMASSNSIGTSTNTASSTSIASFGLTGFGNSTTSNGNSFQPNAAASVFKFGAFVDPSSALPSASTTNISEVSDLKIKSEKELNLGSSSGIDSSVAAKNSGSIPLAPSTSNCTSSISSFQGSLPATANKSAVFDYGLVSQSKSIPHGSSMSLPSLNMNDSMSLSTSLSHPQFNPNQSLGFSTSASSAETGMIKSGSGSTSSVGGLGASSTLSGDGAVSLNAPATHGIFGFGLSSSSTTANAVGSTNGVTPVVNYGGTSVATTSVINNASSSSIGTSGIFNFSASSSASTSAASNIFGSTWESPKPLGFSSTLTTSSPSSVFAFGVSASTAASANATSKVFNSQSGPSSSPNFPFSTSSPAFSLPLVPVNQPIFGNRQPSFTASPSDQMNVEDGMAEDPVQSSAPSIFGQPSISPSPPGFMFGSAAPALSNPFQFNGQQNQMAPLNPSPFQASASLEFNSGGSFSLGSGGGEKSNRKYIKVNRNKNRKK